MFPLTQNKSMSARPNWAEVSLSALQHNFRVVQQHVGLGTTICAVVKCDAYGHGVVECSRALEAAGLLIEAIREPRTPDHMVAAAPGQRRWQRIPLSLHLRAVKP